MNETGKDAADQGFPRPMRELLKRLGLDLHYRAHVQAALTHPSYWGEYPIAEHKRLNASYERLEFLGDSVIALTICSYLFQTHRDYDQGDLSKIKGHLVSKESLARVARDMDIGNYVRLGRGVLHSTGRENISFQVDCFEALVGAVYLEKGFDYAARFVLEALNEEIKKTPDIESLEDYKTEFQEFVQKQYKTLPVYKLLSQTGPEHKKKFRVGVYVNDDRVGTGTGTSKKEAETNAAMSALSTLGAS